jgi:hypothetical protein
VEACDTKLIERRVSFPYTGSMMYDQSLTHSCEAANCRTAKEVFR